MLAARFTLSPIRRTQASFAILMGLASVIGLVKTAVLAKVLGVEDLGLYGLAVLVTQFGVHLGNWGILSALNNQLPLALGRGDERTPELVGRALGAVILASALTGALYLLAVFALPGSDEVRFALAVALSLAVATTLFEFVLLLLRVERRLLPLGAMYVVRALFAVALGAGAGAIWGFTGVIVVEVGLLLAVTLAARHLWLPAVWVSRPRGAETRWLVSRGAPIMLANLIVVGSASIDRVFVAAVLPDELGQYIFATIVVTAWLALSGILAQALAPKYLFEHGAGLELTAIRRKAVRVMAFAGAGGLIGFPILLLAAGALRSGPYSEYRAGLDVMPILYLGGLLNLLAFPGFLLSALRPSLATAAATAGAVVSLGAGAVLSTLDPSLSHFAWVFVASQTAVLLVIAVGVETLVRRSNAAP